MKAGELCNREVVVCRPELPLVEAAKLMRRHNVGDLVVVQEANSGKEPVGILTDRDIVVDGLARLGRVDGLAVQDVMTPELVTSSVDEDVSEVLARMKAFSVRRMPVVGGDGSLEGILTYDDILEWMVEELAELVRLVKNQMRMSRPPPRG